MKLFHITLESRIMDKFYPRVPITIREDENDIIARVCLADSIENCLNLVAWAENERIEDIFTEYATKSLPIRVYEFEIDEKDNNLMCPEDVYRAGVIDAQEFNEYWYIGKEPLIPSKSYVIRIDDSYNQEGVVVFAYESEDGKFTQDDFSEMSKQDDFDEDEFWCSFYFVDRYRNTNLKIYPCEIINPEYCYGGNQVVRLKFENDISDTDDILDILESFVTPFHEDVLDIYLDIHKVSNKVVDIEIDTLFFSLDKNELIHLFAKKGLRLIA